VSDNLYSFLVQPPELEMASTATMPLAFDISPWVAVGDVPTAPTAKLYREPERTEYALGIKGVGLVGEKVYVTVGDLEADQSYLLLVSVNLGVQKKPSGALRIRVPI
jgi:hypothetical protein